MKKILLYGVIIIIFIMFFCSKVDKVEVLSTSMAATMDNVYFDNLEVLTKDTGTASIKNSGITYDINFNKPGEKFMFSFDIVNPTSYNMFVRKLKVTGTDKISFLSYNIKDDKGNFIKKDDVITKRNLKKVYITIIYNDVDELPTEDVLIDLGLDINISM